jgi:hypothetical protein
MSKLDPPTAAISRAVQLIRDRLPNPLNHEIAGALDTIERALDQIRDEWIGDMKMIRELRTKGRRKPSSTTMDRDRKLWEERQGKTWKEFFADHPGEEEQGLRTAVRRHEKRVKRKAELEAFWESYNQPIANHEEDC